ncbi:DUF5117 domain-containing protein [Porphyromonas sp.]|uniref:DUF5117 domain-containing protein n=1 Tax=Porphyromonas sp. TaxID=1924944 RepID=UPI0026DD3AE3|nr:DUF5117 domain-containing protein [Porphyromonas sp.]MDO4770835.1 DUF5117 domain-containing protein [Porphyromonas sp.]
MRYRLLLCIILVQFWCSPIAVASDRGDGLLPPDDDFELVSKGIFSVFQKGQSIYLSIPDRMIGREVEIRAQINSGFDMIARPAGGLGVVRLVKKDDTSICFLKEIYSERVLSNKNPKLINAFSLSNIQSPHKCYNIEAYSPEHGYLIDVTTDIMTGDEWFSYKYANIRQMDPKGSRLIGTASLPDGVSFKVRRQHEYAIDKDKQISYIMVLPKGTMPLEVECIFRLLPERDMPIRLATYRKVPHVIHFTDYTQDDYTAVKDSILVRWDLSSRSKMPITFYIDSLFPEYYVPAVRRSIEFWNDKFRQAGLASPLRIRRADKNTSLASQRAVVAYDLVRPGIEETLTWHPRTGEILSCRLNIGHGFMRDKLADYLLTHALVDKDIVKDNDSRRHAVALLEEELKQKVGTILGVYSPEDLAWAYRPHSRAKDCYQDRERGLTKYGKQNGKITPLSVQVYAERLRNLSVVVAEIETITGEKRDRDITRKASDLYPRACRLYTGCLKELVDNVDAYTPHEQEEAFHILDKYLLSGEVVLDSPYLRARSGSGLWLIQEESLKGVFRHLFEKWHNQYSASIPLQRVSSSLFKDFASGLSLTPYQMNLQLLFVTTWISESDKSPYLRRALGHFYQALEELLEDERDTTLRAHYEFLLLKIRADKSDF